MARGTLIWLNGPSSAGKSTLARALQETLPGTFWYTGTDHWSETVPRGCWNRGEVFSFTVDEAGTPITLNTGPVAREMIAAMVVSVAALVESGRDVVVETGFWEAELQTCREGWAHLNPLRVGVQCPLDVLEARETARGDRMVGLARLQFAVIPRQGYDLELDTATKPLQQCAASIAAHLDKPPISATPAVK